MIMQEIISLSTSKREEMIDITSKVSSLVKNSNVLEGICTVFCQHTSAAIVINENADPNICTDTIQALCMLIKKGVWKHDSMDGNADSHIKATIMGPSETIPINNGKLQLGIWQGIMFFELDGPRERKLIANIIGE